MATSIEIKGVDEIVRKLGKVGAMDAFRPPMQRAVERLQRGMAVYPSQPALANYRRTGTLGRKWTTQIRQSVNQMIGSVGNNTPYAPYVQSHLRQNIHLGYWQTDADVVDANRAAIVADFKRVIDEVIK